MRLSAESRSILVILSVKFSSTCSSYYNFKQINFTFHNNLPQNVPHSACVRLGDLPISGALDVRNSVLNDISNGVLIGVLIGVPNDVQNDVPSGALNRVLNGVLKGLLNEIPDGVLNDILNGVPNGVLNGVPIAGHPVMV